MSSASVLWILLNTALRSSSTTFQHLSRRWLRFCRMNTAVPFSSSLAKKIDFPVLRKFSLTTSRAYNSVFRVLVLGAPGVGKTALVVRFLTRRFIGDYDSDSEQLYQHKIPVGNDSVTFAVLDTLNSECKSDTDLRDQILWADAFLIVYSVTDQCSFAEVDRLKFLINYTKKATVRADVGQSELKHLVCLVGNKEDVFGERMVYYDQGLRKSRDLGCCGFYEVSVRESVAVCQQIFENLYHEWIRKAVHNLLKRPEISVAIERSGSLLRPWQGRKSPSTLSPSPSLPTQLSVSGDEAPVRLKRKSSPKLFGKHLFSGNRMPSSPDETKTTEDGIASDP